MIKDVWWPGWVWVCECFFWYRPTRVVPDKGPLNGCVCVCIVTACVGPCVRQSRSLFKRWNCPTRIPPRSFFMLPGNGQLTCCSLVYHVCVCLLSSLLPSVLWRCWLGGRKAIRPVKNLSSEVLASLFVWSEVLTCIWPSWCHCHSLSLAPVKSRLVLPFWYRLTWVVPEKGR